MSFLSLRDLRKKVITSSLDKVYTLNDISHTVFDHPVCAVLGNPIAHSLSPIFHQRAFQHLSKLHPEYLEWKYIKILVKKDELQLALSLLEARKFPGINLTLPHKTEALKFVNHLTRTARNTQAINTLILDGNHYRGDNTDVFGFQAALSHTFGTIDFSATPVFLYGAGGCARAILEALIQEDVKDLTIINRSSWHLDQVKTSFGNRLPQTTQYLSDKTLSSYPKGLYINATSLGLEEDDPIPIPIHELPQGSLVFDAVYSEHETKLTQASHRKGFRATDGKPMLAYQAAAAFKAWTGHALPPEVFLGQALEIDS